MEEKNPMDKSRALQSAADRSLERFSGCFIAVIDDWYLTSRQEDKRQARERRIKFE